MYDYLNTVAKPRHLQIATSYLGVKEIPGKGSNPIILQWAKNIGVDKIYKDDDMAWCALFFANTMKEAGRPIALETTDLYDYIRALKYQHIFTGVENPGIGDILIFQRKEGGHIGFYVGEDESCYHVLGGNQGNKVSIIRIEKSRCVAKRRPPYITFNPEPYHVSATGQISKNEA